MLLSIFLSTIYDKVIWNHVRIFAVWIKPRQRKKISYSVQLKPTSKIDSPEEFGWPHKCVCSLKTSAFLIRYLKMVQYHSWYRAAIIPNQVNTISSFLLLWHINKFQTGFTFPTIFSRKLSLCLPAEQNHLRNSSLLKQDCFFIFFL